MGLEDLVKNVGMLLEAEEARKPYDKKIEELNAKQKHADLYEKAIGQKAKVNTAGYEDAISASNLYTTFLTDTGTYVKDNLDSIVSNLDDDTLLAVASQYALTNPSEKNKELTEKLKRYAVCVYSSFDEKKDPDAKKKNEELAKAIPEIIDEVVYKRILATGKFTEKQARAWSNSFSKFVIKERDPEYISGVIKEYKTTLAAELKPTLKNDIKKYLSEIYGDKPENYANLGKEIVLSMAHKNE